MSHLIERRRDQATEPDDVGPFLVRGFENLLARNHHAEIDHVETVTTQHDANDILADVVNITLHRREDDSTSPASSIDDGRLLARSESLLGSDAFGFHERFEVGDSLLHHAGTFDHLW